MRANRRRRRTGRRADAARASKARLAVVGGVQFPKRREKRYLAELDRRITADLDLVLELLAECLGQFKSEPVEIAAARKDAAPKLPDVVDLGVVDERALLRMVDTARLGRARFPPDEADLLEVASGVDTFTTGQVSRVVETVVGIDPASTESLVALHREWARTNVDLITSIDSRFFADIAKEVQEAVAKGHSTRQLGKAIEQRTGVARRRAQLIARDQVATLNGKITKARQEAVGVSRYRWSTSQDERVRPEHEEREGVVFAWATPPPDGHPGEPINCRCVAIPVFDTVEGVLEEGSIGGLADFPAPPPAATPPSPAALAQTRAPRMRAAVEAGDLAAVEVIESETAAGRVFGAPEAAKMRQRQKVQIPQSLVSLEGGLKGVPMSEDTARLLDSTARRFRSLPPGFLQTMSKREGTTLRGGKAVRRPWGLDFAPDWRELHPELSPGADLLAGKGFGKVSGIAVGPRGSVSTAGLSPHLASHTALHEAAHGVDDLLKGVSGRPPFRALYKEHRGAIAAWDKEREFGNGAYYLQADHVGPSEFFAEIMADSTEDFRRELLDKHFPGLLEGVAKAIEDSL